MNTKQNKEPRQKTMVLPDNGGGADGGTVKLKLLDADVSGRKLKVVFTESSGRAGEMGMLDRGLARIYERQGKVRIINDNNEQNKED